MADEGGKRSLDDQRHNQNKRPRGDFDGVVFRLVIRSLSAGGVIGKGGENIKRLRSDHDAKVSIPDCNGPERIIKIVTKDVEHGLDCIKSIIPCINDKKAPEDQSSVRILVHQSHAGAIIGRAGFKIKELREKTGAHFKVFTDTCPKSTERVVQLTGNPDVIVKAVAEIYTICTDTPVKGPVQEYDPFCHDITYHNKYGGYVDEQGDDERGGYGGGGGGQWNRGGHMGGPGRGRGGFDHRMGGGQDNFGYGRSPFGGGGGGGGGGPMGGGMGMRGGMGGRGGGRGGRGGMGGRGGYGGGGGGGGGGQQYQDQGYEFGGDRGHGGGFGGGPGGPGGGGSFEGGAGGGEAVETQQVTIPTNLAGSIIGKGGERIRNIRTRSGAQIKIGDPAPGGKDRVITITGTENAIAHAKFLLQNSVREYQNRGGGN